MNTHWWIALVSSFLASGVEVVEAVTIVLATAHGSALASRV
jgi:uncharacterized membrane protein